MKRVLITGGLGFLGIHSVEKWKSNGWSVTVIDNLSSNVVSQSHPLLDGVDVWIDDIVNVKWADLPKFDLILHYASIVGPVGVLKHAGNMANLMLNDVYWVVDGAIKNQCPVIFISTSEIYGWRNEKSYLKESDDKVIHGDFTVRGEYSVAKMLGEIVISNTGKINSDFKFQLIRPFNITGKYQTPYNGFVLPRFVIQAAKNEDITVYYSGEQIRSFTWVNDVVDGIYLTSIAPENLWNQEWNIGNRNNEQSIKDLASRVKELMSSESKIVHVDPKELHGNLFEEAPEKIADSTKIETLLNWSPTKGIDEIIQEVIDYWRLQIGKKHAILLPCWKAPELLSVCVPSILKSISNDSELIVILNEVDNESTTILDFYGVKHFDSNTNLNVSGVDLAIPYIKEMGHKYVTIASSDMLYSDGWDTIMMSELEANYPCSVSASLVEPKANGGGQCYDVIDFFGKGSHDVFNTNVSSGKYKAGVTYSHYGHPIMVRTSDFLDVNGYSDGMDMAWIDAQGRALDDWYAFRLKQNHEGDFKFINLDKALVYHAISLNTSKHPIRYDGRGASYFQSKTGMTPKQFFDSL